MYSSRFLPRAVRLYTKLSPQNDVVGKLSLIAKAFGSKDPRVNVMKLIVIWLLEMTL